MYLSKLQLKNLRCFSDKELEFSAQTTLIEGCNGSGKTTIIEALYYLCYLRSFRTNITQELIRFESDSFFVKAYLSDSFASKETLQVGFSPAKRLVKLNDLQVSSFKELINNYRVVVLTEDDLNIIKGGPELRRAFIDQHIYLQDPDWQVEMHQYKKALDQRNALLKNHVLDLEQYQIWTNQLITRSETIRAERFIALSQIEQAINDQLTINFNAEFTIKLVYQAKNWQSNLQLKEQIMQRTLFGAHLDDYTIELCDKSSRKFASRGQQKLIAILMKIVQVTLLKKSFLGAILFLLDDFITDLDHAKTTILLKILGDLGVQLVFTAPNLPQIHKDLLIKQGAKVVLV